MFQNCKVHPGVTDPVQYHKAEFPRGDVRLPMSPSALKLFGQCPARWIAGYEPPSSKSKEFGNLFDTRALTPELFESRFAVHPMTYEAIAFECPKCKSVTNSKSCRACKCDRVEIKEKRDWNWSATHCLEWRENQNGKEIVSADAVAQCDVAVKALFKDEIIKAFCDASDKQVLVSGEWKDDATGLVIPVRCLMDFVPRVDTEFYKSLGDLKTTRSAALRPFGWFCFNMGYHVQAAFDTDLYVAATDEDRCNWTFILSENYPPFQTGKRILSQSFLQIGRQTYQHLLTQYCRSLKTGIWNDYDSANKYATQGWSVIEPEPSQEFEALSASLERTQETALTEEEEPLYLH